MTGSDRDRIIGWSVALLAGATAWYVGLHALVWAARTWGLERVAVVLTLAVVGLVLGLVAAAEVRDRRARREVTVEPWIDVPWEVRR